MAFGSATTSSTPSSCVLDLHEVGSGRLDGIERFDLVLPGGSRTCEVRVALPLSYNTKKAREKHYPLLLILDAADCFGSAVEMSRLMSETEEVEDCIVVGIDGTPGDFAQADASVLAATVLAECRRRYRVDPAQTTLCGADVAGTCALRAVLGDGEAWRNAIVSNPRDCETLADAAPSVTSAPRRLVLVSGPGPDAEQRSRAIRAALPSSAAEALQVLPRVLHDEPGTDIKTAALASGLQMLFATGVPYGRKVETLRKPYMPGLLRLVSPLAKRLLPKTGKSPADNPYRFRASRTGRDYEIFVCLPASAAGDPARRYPAVFVLDANIEFATVAETAARMAAAGSIEEAIVVGIGTPRAEGAVEFGYRRFEEFAPPADGYTFDDDLGRFFRSMFAMRGEDARRRLGLAPQLLDFIGDELLPQLAAALPIDTARLGLLGHSAGGTFVGYALSQRPQLFRHYAAISPGVGICGSWLLRQPFDSAAITGSGARVFLAVGEAEMRNLFNGIAGIPETGTFAEHLRRQAGLPVTYRCFDGETHSSIFPRAVTQALSSFLVARKPVS